MAIHYKRCEGCCLQIPFDEIIECEYCGELYCLTCMQDGKEDSKFCQGCFEETKESPTGGDDADM